MNAQKLYDQLVDADQIRAAIESADETTAEVSWRKLADILLRNVAGFGPPNPQNCSTIGVLLVEKSFPGGRICTLADDLLKCGELVPEMSDSDVDFTVVTARVCSFIAYCFEESKDLPERVRHGAKIINKHLEGAGYLPRQEDVMDI